jgi:hypothetical protein
MTRMRTHRSSKYFTISNETAQDHSLSFEALGLLTYCLSMPEDWTFHPKLISSQRGRGRDYTYGVFNELIKKYHCIRVSTPNPKFPNLPGTMEYELFDDVDDCKSRMEQLKLEGKIINHENTLKKCFQNTEFQDLETHDTEKPDITKETGERKETKKEYHAPSKADAPKKSRFVQPKKIGRAPNVETTDEEHNKLCEKYPPDLLRKIYNALSDWKESKLASSPKEVTKHTDYYRIIKWVAKQVIEENQTNKNIVQKSESKHDYAMRMKQEYYSPNEACEIYVNAEGISFIQLKGNAAPITIPFAFISDKDFKERVDSTIKAKHLKKLEDFL